MKTVIALTLMLSALSGCSAFSPDSDPEPNQAAKTTHEAPAQGCNSPDGHCAKPVSPSFH